jgi:hypothetical protein
MPKKKPGLGRVFLWAVESPESGYIHEECIDCPAAFASRLTIAVRPAALMLTVPPSSRAGSLPQGATGAYENPQSTVGAGLLAKNDDAVELTERLVLWVDDIQRPING